MTPPKTKAVGVSRCLPKNKARAFSSEDVCDHKAPTSSSAPQVKGWEEDDYIKEGNRLFDIWEDETKSLSDRLVALHEWYYRENINANFSRDIRKALHSNREEVIREIKEFIEMSPYEKGEAATLKSYLLYFLRTLQGEQNE